MANEFVKPNQTREDAYLRVAEARAGSFIDATDEYLLALRQQLAAWDAEIHAELARRIAAEQKRNEV